MNRLHGIESAEPFLVTLNATDTIDPETVVARMRYSHPIYTHESVAAQRELASLNSESTVFAGAYHGWGFHEDGCRSGVAAAAGVAWHASGDQVGPVLVAKTPVRANEVDGLRRDQSGRIFLKNDRLVFHEGE